MDLELNAEHLRCKAAATQLADEVLRGRAKHADEHSVFVKEQMVAVAKAGLLGMLVPKEVGGLGVSSVAYALAVTEIARACASTAVTMAVTNMVADALYTFGNAEQKKEFIPSLVSGDRISGSFALSEPGAGSDAAALSTSAHRVRGGYRLNGEKCWITSGDHSGIVLVMARTDPKERSRGISAFVVEPGLPGLSVGQPEKKMGLRGSSTVSLLFEDVFVPEERRLGAEGIGFQVAMRALDGGRIGISAQALGIAWGALLEARLLVGPNPTQKQQWALADGATELDAARLLNLRAADRKDRGLPFTKEASMAKLFASEAANRTVNRCLELVHASGHQHCDVIERALRDVRVTTIYEGTSEIQRLVIARKTLTESEVQ